MEEDKKTKVTTKIIILLFKSGIYMTCNKNDEIENQK